SSLIKFIIFFFFFSSRRRHTRLQGDWSSDVCSSDLGVVAVTAWLNVGVVSTSPSAAQSSAVKRSGRVRSERSGPEVTSRGPEGRSEERRVGKEGGSRRAARH